MSDTISDTRTGVDQQQLAQQLLAAARVDGMELAGPGGLLIGVDQTVLETALEAEMREHRGYAKNDPAGRAGPTCRRRTKTVLAEVGPALIEVLVTGTAASSWQSCPNGSTGKRGSTKSCCR